MSDPSIILVVEDDDIVRMLIVDVLDELEFKVLEAGDAQEALVFLTNDAQRIDLMMTDRGLPDMSGGDLALKALELRPSLPILFASGYSDSTNAPAGTHTIGKPFSIDQLRDKVNGILGD